jgi:hypothetical protein
MSNGNGANPLDQSILDSSQPQQQPPPQQSPVSVSNAPLSSSDLNAQVNALIKGNNQIQMPDKAPDPSDLGATAQYQAIQLAKTMQDGGTPMNREQFRTLVSGQYNALVQQQVERQKEIFKAGLDVQTEALKRALPRDLDATNADQLASYADSWDSLNNLMALHKTATDNNKLLGNVVTGNNPMVQGADANAVEYNAYRDTILGKVARGIGGDSRVDNKDLDIARNFLPNLGDSPTVAAAKTLNLQKHIAGVMERQLQFYQANGFKVQPMMQGPLKTMQDANAAAIQKVNNAPGPTLSSQTAAHANSATRLSNATSRQAQANAFAAPQPQQPQLQPQPQQPQLQQQ